jgi:prepilin-type N-terminal cleavage/methylation domain-containing protein
MKKRCDKAARGEAGFSLIELMVALGVTLVIMVVASRMLAMSMAVRTRENQRTEAIADVQRALQTMTREISNAGLGLSGTNGLVDANSDDITIRVRSNLNAFCGVGGVGCDANTSGADEDVVFTIINNVTVDDSQWLITRQDVNTGAISPLANRVDGLTFSYLKADATTAATTPHEAAIVRIAVTVNLAAVGSPGSPGYQPATRMRLTSDAVLRNLLLAQ